jgi:hypothetical protein
VKWVKETDVTLTGASARETPPQHVCQEQQIEILPFPGVHKNNITNPRMDELKYPLEQ